MSGFGGSTHATRNADGVVDGTFGTPDLSSTVKGVDILLEEPTSDEVGEGTLSPGISRRRTGKPQMVEDKGAPREGLETTEPRGCTSIMKFPSN